MIFIFKIELLIFLCFGEVKCFLLPDGLIQQKHIRDCGVIYGYEHDRGCFMEHSSAGEIIRPCAATLFDPSTCGCTIFAPQNYHPNPECGKAQINGAYILYSPGNTPHSGNTQTSSSTQHNSQHVTYTDHCDSNPSYTKVLHLQQTGIQCTTLDDVIEDLYQIALTDIQMTCMTKLMTALKNFTLYHSDACACETSHQRFYWPRQDHRSLSCSQHHSSYNTLIYRYYSHHNQHTRTCVSLSEAFSLLDQMNDLNCVTSFVDLLGGTFHNLGKSYHCHCTIQTSDSCRQIQEYNDVINVVKSDHCLSSIQVWTPLKKLQNINKACGEIVIEELSNTYDKYDSTGSSCTCAQTQTQFHFVSLNGGLYQSCKNNQHYMEINNDAFGHPMTCQTHHKLWASMVKIKQTEGNHDCVYDLIRHMAASVEKYGNPCSCGHAAISTTPLTSTTSSTTATTTSTTIETKTTTASSTTPLSEFSCNKLETITSLFQREHITLASTPTCNDGTHTLPEAAVQTLCHTPDSSSWKPGRNVLQNCNSIPHYTAIASFTNDWYFQEGRSGVFMGCNSTTLSIATQFCAIPMDIVHLTVGTSHIHYYETPQFYFTIAK